MQLQTFNNRIHNGKSNRYLYSRDGHEGCVSVWKHEDSLILTWEECPAGEWYNEHLYTRDERHVFVTIDELIEFLRKHGLHPELFTP